MAKRGIKALKRKREVIDTPEKQAYLNALQIHGRVMEESACGNGELPAGVTHVLSSDANWPRLIEKRKSFF